MFDNRFIAARDESGKKVSGLYIRGTAFYMQARLDGEPASRRHCLRDDAGKTITTLAEAVQARVKVLLARQHNESPAFAPYVHRYLKFLKTTQAKSPLTIEKERYSLTRWGKFFGLRRLDKITHADLNEFVMARSEGEVSNRTVNLDVIALHNMFEFGVGEGVLRRALLPTVDWKPLRHRAPKRTLIPDDAVEKICTEAVLRNADGTPKHHYGPLIADYVKLLAYSGARKRAALTAKWSQVDWGNRQITLYTKFDRRVVVDCNEKLEAHLKDMKARASSDWMFPGPTDYLRNPHNYYDPIRIAAGFPSISFHDFRHYFTSHAIMNGVDAMTVALWLGHSDGGKLIGTVYGHLNDAHCKASALKVSFPDVHVTTKLTYDCPESVNPDNLVAKVSG